MLKACSAEGLLEKKSVWLKKWNSRYMRVRGRTLCYYDSALADVPRGEVSLVNAAVVPAALIKEGRRYGIVVTEMNKGKTTEYYFAAESEDDRQYWLKAMKAVVKSRPKTTAVLNEAEEDNNAVDITVDAKDPGRIYVDEGEEDVCAIAIVPPPPADATDPLSYLMSVSTLHSAPQNVKQEAKLKTKKDVKLNTAVELKSLVPLPIVSGSSLIAAVKDGNIESVVSILEQEPNLCTFCDSQNQSLLHLACMFNHEKISIHLIALGANIAARNGQGETPIEVAPATLQRKLRIYLEPKE